MPHAHKQRTFLKGFTLIELLVVISIISLLASIVLASLNSARVKARDARRIADLGQIRTALEFYFDSNGYYPGVSPTGIGGISGNCSTNPRSWDCNGYNVSYNANWDSFASDLSPYISTLPKDPLNGACEAWTTGCFSYGYGNVGRVGTPGGSIYQNPNGVVQYDLFGQLEDTSNPQRCGTRAWKFYFDSRLWCGSYSPQIYEASTT